MIFSKPKMLLTNARMAQRLPQDGYNPGEIVNVDQRGDGFGLSIQPGRNSERGTTWPQDCFEIFKADTV
jgi:hypothetical protein